MILVGEMRDEETVRTALSARPRPATSCSRTLHTVDAAETVNRIIDFFPPHQQQQARAMLAGTLQGRDLPAARADRRRQRPRRRPARCCAMTGRVRDMIMNPDETGKLREVIAEGAYYGMQTFDQALLQPRAGRAGSRWRTRSRPPPTRTTSSCSCRPTAALHLGRVGLANADGGRSRWPRPRRRTAAGRA